MVSQQHDTTLEMHIAHSRDGLAQLSAENEAMMKSSFRRVGGALQGDWGFPWPGHPCRQTCALSTGVFPLSHRVRSSGCLWHVHRT